jgi:hypothetical protein
MRLHYAGKYSGNPDDLPHREHEPGAVKFKEASDYKTFGKMIAKRSVILVIVLVIVAWIRAKDVFFPYSAVFIYLLTVVPHELLHAICYKEDVYLYHNFENGMLFVIGTESTSKARFIFRSLLPSIVLGFIPYIVFLVNPEYKILGILGALGIGTAAGDFYNAGNSLRQIPKGGWAYLCKENTYWFIPGKREAETANPE